MTVLELCESCANTGNGVIKIFNANNANDSAGIFCGSSTVKLFDDISKCNVDDANDSSEEFLDCST